MKTTPGAIYFKNSINAHINSPNVRINKLMSALILLRRISIAIKQTILNYN